MANAAYILSPAGRAGSLSYLCKTKFIDPALLLSG
jgi:hypothetical protein